ncbi:MAG: GDP-mannose 4,6-dehydratase [Patescibacteria group bacterium]
MLNNRRVLIAGGAGFIGSHVTQALIGANVGHVVVADNLCCGSRANLVGIDVEFCMCDVSELSAVRSVIQSHSVDTVLNLTTRSLPYSLEHPFPAVQETVTATQTLCELQREGAFETLIHFSSSEIYGNAQGVPMTESHPISPMTPYAAAKAACDHIVLSYHQTFGTRSYVLRPFNQFGPREHIGKYSALIPRVIGAIAANESVIVNGDGMQSRDFLFVSDLAHATVSLLEKPVENGEIIHIASGEERTVNEVIEIIASLMDAHPEVIHVAPRPADVIRHVASVEKAKKLLSWTPSVELKEGLRRTIHWHCNEHSAGKTFHRRRRMRSNLETAA